MVIDLPPGADDRQLPAVIDTPEKIVEHSRKLMSDIANATYGDLQELVDNREALNAMTVQEVIYLRALHNAATKHNDPKWFNTFQDHYVGRAVQRVQMQSHVFTYQDLLNDVAKKEAAYQEACGNVIDVDVVAPPAPPPPIDWGAL